MALTNTQLITELYIGYYNRAPDPTGLQFWLNALAGGESLTQVANQFAQSSESLALYPYLSLPSVASASTFVTSVYNNILNRAPDTAGLNFWVNELQTNQTTPGAFIATLEASVNMQVGTADALTLANKVTVGDDFVSRIVNANAAFDSTTAHAVLAGVTSDPATIATGEAVTISYLHPVVVTPTVTVVLTTGIDTLVGQPNTNYIYTATVDNNSGIAAGGSPQTLNAFDTISGGNGTNVLNVYDFGLGSWIGGSTNLLGSSAITGITALNIASLEGVTGTSSPGFNVNSALNLTGWTALTALNITASNNYYNIVRVGDNVAVSLVDTGSSSEYNLVFGGSTITVNNNSPEYTYNYLTGGSATTSVSVSGVAENYIYDQHNSANQGYDGGGSTPGWSAGTNSITTYNATNQDDDSYNYIYSDALTTLNLTNNSYAYSYIYAASGTRTLAVNLSNDGNSTAHPGQELYVQDNTATNVAVTASGTATKGLSLEASSATSLTFNDAVGLSFYDGTAAGSQYLSASSATSVAISGAGAFTADLSGINALAVVNASSSSGVITVELASASSATGTQSFTGGSGQDIVAIGGTQTGLVTGGSAANNEIILLDVASATEANIAPSIVSHFSVLGVIGATAGTFDLSGLPAYTSFDVISSNGDVSFDNVAASSTLSIDNLNNYNITLQAANSTGSSDSASVTLGTASTGGITVSQISLLDAASNGIGTVALISNASSSSVTNYVTTLTDGNIASLAVSGIAGLNIGNAVTSTSSSLAVSATGTSASQALMFAGGIQDAALTSLTVTGPEQTAFGTILHSTNGINVTGGNATISLALGTVTSSGHSDVVTLGDGNNVVTDTAAASGANVNITLGNGNNTVIVGAAATNTVTVGTGANNIVEAAGGNVALTFGTHTTSTVDNFTVGAQVNSTIAPSGVISGMNITGNDTITFSGDAGANALVTFTIAQINTFGGNPTTLAAAVAGVLSAGGGNLAQHAVGEFQFQGNIYLVEQAGAAGSTFAPGDTVVELTGLQTVTSATTVTGGVLHLHG